MSSADSKKFLSTIEAAHASGYTRDYLIRLCRAGKIIAVQNGRNWSIDPASLSEFIEQQKVRKEEFHGSLSESMREMRQAHEAAKAPQAPREKEKPYLTTAEAAAVSGYTRDYLIRLCRARKISAKIEDRSWRIEAASLFAFVAQQKIRKEEFRDTLSGSLKESYHAAKAPATPVYTIPVRSPLSRRPTLSWTKEAFAIIIALLVVSAAGAEAGALPVLSGKVATVLRSTGTGFALITADEVNEIQRNIASIRGSAEGARTSVGTTFAQISAPALSSEIKLPTTKNLALNTIAQPILSQTKIVLATTSAASSPALPDLSTLLSPSQMQALVAQAPVAVSRFNLAFGSAIISATHFAINADVSSAYGISAAAPATARVIVLTAGNTGLAFARATAHLPSVARNSYLAFAQTISDAAPKAASLGWSVEYAIGSNLFGGATAAIALGASAVHDTTTLAHQAQSLALALAGRGNLQDRVLGVVGKSALALQNAAAATAAQPALSATEKIAVSTYFALHDLFSNAQAVFSGPPTTVVVLPTQPQQLEPVHLATTTPLVAVSGLPVVNKIENIQSNPNYVYNTTTIVKGVSTDFVNQSLASLRTELLGAISSRLQPIQNQVATNVTTIQQVNMIQNLTDLILHTPKVDGATIVSSNFTGGGTVDATNGSFTNFSATNATLGASSFGGAVNISGDLGIAGTTTTANLTATNATSTNGYFQNLVAVNSLFTNTTTTNATSTNLFASNTVFGSATSTNLFATLAHATTGIVDTLSSTLATITGLNVTNSTTTSATSTNEFSSNFVATSATTTNDFASNFKATNATTSALTVSGLVYSNLIPSQNKQFDLGSAGNFWRNGYLDTLNVNNLAAASTSISGTANASFTINSANSTNDTQDMQIIFYRGTATPNALLSWNSTLKRFETNFPLYVPSASTTQLSVTQRAYFGATATSTFDSAGNLALVSNGLTVGGSQLVVSGGNVGIGTTTPFASLSVAGNGFFNGNITSSNVTATGTLAVLGASAYTGLASFTLASTSQLSVFQNAYFGATATSTFTSTGALGIASSSPWALLSINPNALGSGVPEFAIGSTTNTHFIVTGAGSVGIGTTTPRSLINPTASKVFTLGSSSGFPDLTLSNSSTPQELSMAVNTGAFIDVAGAATAANNFIAFRTSNTAANYGAVSEAMRITSNGNVGIGSSSPSTKFVVSTGANTDLAIGQISNASGFNIIGLNGSVDGNAFTGLAGGNTSTKDFYIQQGNSSSNIVFRNAGTEQVRITATGNVGIGTTTPNAPLDVYSNSNYAAVFRGIGATAGAVAIGGAGTGNAGLIQSATNDSLTATSPLVINPSGGYVDIATTTSRALLTVDNSTAAYTATTIAETNSAAMAFSIISRAGTGYDTMTFGSMGSGSVGMQAYNYSTNAADKILINPFGGNVGIGTTTPQSKLVVSSSITAGATVAGLVLNGQYGSGTSVQTLDFSLNGDANPSARIGNPVAGAGTGELAFYTTTNYDTTLPTEKLRITGAGNVGIGTTSPYTTLAVSSASPSLAISTGAGGDTMNITNASVLNNTMTGGSMSLGSDKIGAGDVYLDYPSTGNLYVRKTGGAAFAAFNSSGNFGVGTTTPSHALDVSSNSIAQLRLEDNSNGGSGLILTNASTVTNWYVGSQNHTSSAFEITPSSAVGNTTFTTPAITILSNGNLGIAGVTNPRTALDTGTGTLSGAANDYIKAQFTMSGGGTVTWAGGGGKLKWTTRFIAIPVSQTTASSGYIDITQPTTNIPAGQVYDGVARTADANGVVLNSWEALWAVHTPGGSNSAVSFYITKYTSSFNAPSNWILVAAVNGDDNAVKLGDGYTLAAGGSYAEANQTGSFVNLQASTPGTQQTGNLNISGTGIFSGNVGIGDTAPAGKLSVLTSNDTTPTSITAFDSRHFVVGAGASAGGVAISYNSTSHTGYISAVRPNAAWDSLVLNSNDLSFQTGGGSTRMSITSTGKVGIGTTTPQSALAVIGNAEFAVSGAYAGNPQDVQIINNSGSPYSGQLAYGTDGSGWKFAIAKNQAGTITNQLVVQDNGNVGIGTTGPSYKLDVNGTINSASTISAATEVNAPNFRDSTGSYNVNLGSGGTEGRGLVAGYSGGSYGGIGYNVRHTSTSATWIAPSADTSSYLLFTGGGFTFYGAAGGTAGRTLSYTTLGSISSTGAFTGGTYNGQTISSAASFTGTVAVATSLQIGTYGGITQSPTSYGTLSTTIAKGGYYGLLLGNSSSFANLMYDGSGNGGIYYESPGVWEQYYIKSTGHLTINGSGDMGTTLGVNGTISASGAISGASFSGAGTGLTGTAPSLTAGTVTTNANLTGPITSVGNATSIASQTGTGTTFVMSASPTISGTLTGAAANFSGNVTVAGAPTDAPLTIAGASETKTAGVNHYQNVLSYYIGAGGQTGTVDIKLPIAKYSPSTMFHIVIRGYDYTTNGAWEVITGGYFYSSGLSTNVSATIIGRAPFSTVRWANDGTRNVILLGTTGTSWSYGTVEVSDVVTTFNNIDGYGSGWAAALLTSEAGIASVSTPAIDTRVDTSGNFIAAGSVTGSSFTGAGTGLTGTASSLTAGAANSVTFNSGLTTASAPTFAGLTLTGDITTYRGGAPTTGVIYLGNSGTRYLYYDGSSYTLASAGLSVGGAVNASSFSGSGSGLTGTASSLTAGALVNFVNQSGSRYSTDFNTILQTGFYNADATPTNSPGGSYGQLIVAKGIDTGLQIYGGYTSDNLWFRGWSGSGAGFTTWRTILHSGNFNSYAPTLTGTGASGTWGINVTGSAATAVRQPSSGDYVWNAATTEVNLPNGITNSFVQASDGFPSYGTVINARSYSSGGGGGMQIYVPYGSGYGGTAMRYRLADYSANSGDPPWTAWKTVLDSTNFNSYSPTLTGTGASGTWGINVTGSASTVTTAAQPAITSVGTLTSLNVSGTVAAGTFSGSGSGLTGTGSSFTSGATNFVNGPDGDRDAGTKLPTTSVQGVRFDFVNAGTTGTGGNYAGVMTYAPWVGTTASTGDASYQLAFGSTAANGGGLPQLNVRKGIDSTWNSWYTILHSGNFNSYAPTLTGTGASGTWGINVTGSASTVTTAAQPAITSVGTLTSLSISGPIYRTAAGTGYMNGGYGGIENSATSGAIYSIGGSYVPGAGNLGNMYGIGYGYNAGGAFTVSGAGAGWGLYVASAGTGDIFLNSDNGIIYSTGGLSTAGTINGQTISSAANFTGSVTASSGTITGNALRSNSNVYTDQNYGYGLVGVYSSTRYQGVFAMGSSYTLAADGSSPGSLYGIAWTHENIGGQSKAGLSHQALFMTNGVTQTAIGTGIWTIGNLTFGSANPTISASSYFLAPGGAYFNSGTVYMEAQLQARGGIHDDNHANLTIAGGSSGYTYFSGNVGIGVSSPSYPLTVTGNISLSSLPSRAGTDSSLCLNGTLVEVSSISCQGISSIRFKDSVETIPNSVALADVMAFRPVAYHLKAAYGDPVPTHLGYIAEEINKIDPRLVVYDTDGVSPYALKYDEFTAVLGGAIAQINNVFTVENPTTAGTSTIASFYEGTTTPAMTFDISGNVTVGAVAATTTAKLTVSGNVLAGSYEVAPTTSTAFTLGSTTLVAEIPAAVLTAAGTVDLYKLSTYNLSGITALANALALQSTRMDSLEARIAVLESGAIGTGTSTPFSTTTLIAGLGNLGVTISNGMLQVGKLIAAQFTVGSATKPTGITLYDTATGAPYCVSIVNGVSTTAPGICTVTTISTSTPPQDNGSGSGNTGTTTPPANNPPSNPPTGGDTTPPVVTLNGAAALQLTVGDTFTDPGATALDDTDGDLTTHIIVSGSVDTSTAGIYTLTYSATDAAGNTRSVSRVVTVN